MPAAHGSRRPTSRARRWPSRGATRSGTAWPTGSSSSQTSYLDGVEDTFDLIAANPPYVKDGDKPALAADVRHEPDVALFGGADGLRDVEAVLDAAIGRLRPAAGW